MTFDIATKFGVMKMTATHVAATRIEQLRREKGLTQRDLSLMIGKNHTFIYNIEASRKNLTIENLHKICIALEVTSQELLAF